MNREFIISKMNLISHVYNTRFKIPFATIINIVIIIIIDPYLPRKIIGSPPVPSYAHGRHTFSFFLLWLSRRSSQLFPTSAKWIACTQDFGVQSTRSFFKCKLIRWRKKLLWITVKVGRKRPSVKTRAE